MEKRTIVDQIEVKRDGTLQIKMRNVLVEDDGSITDLGILRTSAAPGMDLATILDAVDQQSKTGGLPQAEKDFIAEVKDAMWTQERVDAKQAEMSATISKD